MEGEKGLTRRLAETLGLGDCYYYDACPGPGGLLYNIDGYAEEHSRYPFLTLADWGYRSVASAVSDIVASGGEPLAILYSLGTRSRGEALEVASGVADAARDIGLVVLKSDLNRASKPWIDVAAIGRSRRPVSRRGARPGDVVVQAGYLGYGLLEHLVYTGRVPLDPALGVAGFGRRLPPLGAWRVVSGYASASSDNSDGWAATLANIAEASGVGIVLEELHGDPGVVGLLEDYAPSLDLDSMLWGSWEDYNLALTLPGGLVEEALDSCRVLAIPCWVVGRVVEGSGLWFRGERIDAGGGWSWL